MPSEPREPMTPATTDTSRSRREVLRAAGGVAVGAILGGAVRGASAQSTKPGAPASPTPPTPPTPPKRSASPLPATARAGGSDLIKIGLIGCGGRGRGAMINALGFCDGLELHALGDVFADQVDAAVEGLAKSKDAKVRDADKTTEKTRFSGFDNYKRVIESEAEYILIACPPYFHPYFAEAAVDAGKHVFCEKPGAIDGPGVRALYRCGEKAAKQNTGFLAGTQRRHDVAYAEIVRRIHEGAIGKPLFGEAVWNNTDWTKYPRKPGWTEMEWQIRSWRMNRWLCGDTPGVLAIHFIDSVNWALGETPESAYGVGGKIARDSKLDGNIWDHHLAELTYKGGAHVIGGSRITPGDDRHVDNLVGTEGTADLGTKIEGKNPFVFLEENPRPKSSYNLAHMTMVQSIRDGKPLNEAARLAEASLSAILVREAGYTGRRVTWDFMKNESQRHMGPDAPPETLKLGPSPLDPVAVPGEYELI